MSITTDQLTVTLSGNVPKQFDGRYTVLGLGLEQAQALYEQLHGLKQIFYPEAKAFVSADEYLEAIDDQDRRLVNAGLIGNAPRSCP